MRDVLDECLESLLSSAYGKWDATDIVVPELAGDGEADLVALRDFVCRGLPVVLKGAAHAWPCARSWVAADGSVDAAAMLAALGDCDVPTADYGPGAAYDGRRGSTTMARYLDDLRTGAAARDAIYMKDFHFALQAAKRGVAASALYSVPAPFRCDWLNHYWLTVRRGADDFRFIYYGPAGSVTPLHHDVYRSHSWSANLAGTKLWILVPPADTPLLAHARLDDTFPVDLRGALQQRRADGRPPHPLVACAPPWTEEQRACFPRAHLARFAVVEQGPGDVLFTPSGWYHMVVNGPPPAPPPPPPPPLPSSMQPPPPPPPPPTLSLNHNWFGPEAAPSVCDFLLAEWRAVRKALRPLRPARLGSAVCGSVDSALQASRALSTVGSSRVVGCDGRGDDERVDDGSDADRAVDGADCNEAGEGRNDACDAGWTQSAQRAATRVGEGAWQTESSEPHAASRRMARVALQAAQVIERLRKARMDGQRRTAPPPPELDWWRQCELVMRANAGMNWSQFACLVVARCHHVIGELTRLARGGDGECGCGPVDLLGAAVERAGDSAARVAWELAGAVIVLPRVLHAAPRSWWEAPARSDTDVEVGASEGGARGEEDAWGPEDDERALVDACAATERAASILVAVPDAAAAPVDASHAGHRCLGERVCDAAAAVAAVELRLLRALIVGDRAVAPEGAL